MRLLSSLLNPKYGLPLWNVLHPVTKLKRTAHSAISCHQAIKLLVMMDQTITGQEHARVYQRFLCHRTDSFNEIEYVGRYKDHWRESGRCQN